MSYVSLRRSRRRSEANDARLAQALEGLTSDERRHVYVFVLGYVKSSVPQKVFAAACASAAKEVARLRGVSQETR